MHRIRVRKKKPIASGFLGPDPPRVVPPPPARRQSWRLKSTQLRLFTRKPPQYLASAIARLIVNYNDFPNFALLRHRGHRSRNRGLLVSRGNDRGYACGSIHCVGGMKVARILPASYYN